MPDKLSAGKISMNSKPTLSVGMLHELGRSPNDDIESVHYRSQNVYH